MITLMQPEDLSRLKGTNFKVNYEFLLALGNGVCLSKDSTISH